MNRSELKDNMAFADLRAATGHDEKFVYEDGAHYRHAGAPETAEDFRALVYMGGQGNN